MKLAILLNRDRPRLRTLGKAVLTVGWEWSRGRPATATPVLPEFDGLPRLLDADPLVLGTGEALDVTRLAGADALLWEWGWTPDAARRVLEIRARVDLPLLMFPGPLDRFWRELDARDLPVHFEALRATDAIGVMLADTASFYAGLAPGAHVCHLPVPVDTERFARLAVPPAERDPDLVLLTAPSRVCGGATQMPITTYLTFARLAARRPALRGVCFCYDDEERAQVQALLRELGLASRVDVRRYVRPLPRFLEQVRRCALALTLPHALVQGRLALMLACLEVPMVTSDGIETHRRLYPRTSVPCFDVEAATRRCEELLDEPAVAAEVARGARAAVEYYGLAPAGARLADALAAARRRPALEEGA
jgi:hypothetical protein